MSQLNASWKNIDIKTQEGLDLLKAKAKYYGHYAEQLKVIELIQEIENLNFLMTEVTFTNEEAEDAVKQARKELGQ